MRIISWNINSVRMRLFRLLDLLKRYQPEIVCLQETKVQDGSFPVMEIGAAGYGSIPYGQSGYNGVAFLYHNPTRQHGLIAPQAADSTSAQKIMPADVRFGFQEDPFPKETRVMSALFGGLRLVNVYVVNGVDVEDEQFKAKQVWISALGRWLARLPQTPPVLVVGDFNIAPGDLDVWDPVGLKNRIHCTIEERRWMKELQGERFDDIMRSVNGDSRIYTWWPYRQGAFESDQGLRFDGVIGDKKLVNVVKAITVDKEERRPSGSTEKPSDHAPIVIDIDIV